MRGGQLNTFAQGQFMCDGFGPIAKRYQEAFLVDRNVAAICMDSLCHQLSTLSYRVHSSTIPG